MQSASHGQREAEVLASLNHPNVSQIYGLERLQPHLNENKDSATIALVMELVEGLTIDDMLARRSTFRRGAARQRTRSRMRTTPALSIATSSRPTSSSQRTDR
jgi:serine/threonine protein kinase